MIRSTLPKKLTQLPTQKPPGHTRTTACRNTRAWHKLKTRTEVQNDLPPEPNIFWITMGPGQSGMYRIHLVGRWPWWYCPLQGGFSSGSIELKGWIFILTFSPFCKPTIKVFLDSRQKRGWILIDTTSQRCRKSGELRVHWTQAAAPLEDTSIINEHTWPFPIPINHKQYRFKTIIKIIESNWPSFIFLMTHQLSVKTNLASNLSP